MTVYEKLLTVQTKLKAPKSQYNNFGKYSYRNCEDILEAVKPLCAEVKATVVLVDEIVMVGERYYVRATASFIDTETVKEVCASAYAREEETKKGMDGSQVTGASSSYARKYALNGLFAIDDSKDSDTTNTHGKCDGDESEESERNATPKQIEILKKVYVGENFAKLLEANGIENIEELPMSKASEIIAKLKKKVEEKVNG